MSRKVYNLASTITTAVATIAVAVVSFIGKGPVAAINASIVVASEAAITIMGNFVKGE